MNNKLRYILLLIITLNVSSLFGQNSQILYFMNIPQAHALNPALRPSNSLYIGLPVISGINFNINNNFVNFSDVLIKGQEKDSIISFLHPDYNSDKFLAKIRDKNFFDPETSIQLLGIGFSLGNDGYVFLDINDRVEGNIVLPGDLFRLALKGNEQFAGSTIDLSSLRASMKYYREFGLGYSRNITDKLRVGVKGKLLFGIATASLQNNSLGITVNDDFTHTFNADMGINISAPVSVYMDSKHNIDSIVFDDERFKHTNGITDFFTGKKNFGLGIDIGATYELNERVVLSASFTDLGFIRWKKDVTKLSANNTFEFSGLNMVDYFNGSKTMDEIGQDMVDSLKDAFQLSKSNSPFVTYLPFGFSVGGSFSVTKQFSVGLLSYSRIIEKQVREAVTVSANLNLGNVFSTTLCYTASNQRYNNLGAGFAVRAGVTQFYLVSDRIPVMWNRLKSDHNTYVLPDSWNTINLRFGMILVFGNKVREKKDVPMIQVN